MKRIIMVLLFILCLVTSCKVTNSLNIVEDKNKYDITEDDTGESIVKEEIKVTYYLDELNSYECTQKVGEVVIPDYIFSEEVMLTDSYSFIDLEQLYSHHESYLNYALKFNRLIFDDIAEKYYGSAGLPCFLVDWYLDFEFTKPATSNIDDDVILYAKPYAFVLQNKATAEMFGAYLTLSYSLNYTTTSLDEVHIKKSNYTLLNYDASWVREMNRFEQYEILAYPAMVHFRRSSYPFKCLEAKKLIVINDYFVYYNYDERTDKKIIKRYDFSLNSNIEEIVIEGDIDELRRECFCQLTNLKRITFTGNVGLINDWAFSELPLLEEINFNTVGEISDNAFSKIDESVKINIGVSF